MFKKLSLASTVSLALLASACTRIETGEVGLRVNASKQVEGAELLEGSFNQEFIGSVMTFPIKDISISLENKNPLTSDNSALADFDLNVVYSITPSAVSDLWTKKSKSFHYTEARGSDTYLMYNYITTLVNNSSYKAVRNYKSLEVADNRAIIENEIKDYVMQQLKTEGLDTSLNIVAVQVRNVQPNADILASATAYVQSQNQLKIKENEVKLAKLESERMQALSNNSANSIQFMQAQASLNISEAVKAGKVQTIIIPSNMTSLMINK